MKNLHILTNNNLGSFFWEQRIGLFNSIKINQLNLESFNHHLTEKSNFILLDFYFSKISMQKELQMITKIKNLAHSYPGKLKLFILSPLFTDTELEYLEIDNKTIVSHNFTTCFLKTFLTVISSNNQIKVS